MRLKTKYLVLINLARTAIHNAKINEVKSKIPNFTNLVTTTALITVKNKIPDCSKYITSPEFNNLTAEKFTAKLKQTNLATKGDIADFVNTTDFDDKLKKIDKKIISNQNMY